ncbi:MAG: hypothetical protein Q7S57_00585 [bacterium]|nr:hypothetical protein [bacterium]
MGCIIEPAINVYAKEEYIRRITSAKKLAPIIQFDVIDGVFAQPGNFNDPEIVKNNLPSRQIDLHLMVMDFKRELDGWLKIKPERVIIHIEQPGDLGENLKILAENNIKKGLAVAPFTPLEKLIPFVGRIDYLLLMSVVPGRNGQKFIPETINKLKILRAKYKTLQIGVDGGIEQGNVSELVKGGANNIVVGSALFNGDVGKRYQELTKIITQQ